MSVYTKFCTRPYGALKDGSVYNQYNLTNGAVYPTTDIFQVKITDPHGGSTIQSISVPHYGPYLPPTPPGGGGGKKPIAVDLNGNGFEFVNVDDSNVFFDVNGDGWKHRTSWIGKDDGLLAYDIDGDGKIDKAGELSFARYKEGAQTDLEGLAGFDSNGDDRFDAADEKWSKFGIWQDADQNGVTDSGEFRTLGQMGITAVQLESDGKFQVINGQTVHGVGAMTKADGSQLAIADVTLAYSKEILVPGPDGDTTVVQSSPFSPSGEEIDGTDGKDLVLGKNGNNIVKAGAGDDVVFEDGGNDIVDGGDGNDLIYSGADNDLVLGGNGDDAIYAGLGSDIVLAGDGHDAIFAEGGNDVVFAGAGNDLVAGGWGNDVLSGDDGDDQLFGESGNDALFGRDGNDELLGMDGDDRLEGGAGDDLLDGGADIDEMIGGAGNDTYVVDSADEQVVELAGEGTDTVRTNLDGYGLGATLENLTLTGSTNLSGTGNDAANFLKGNYGNNVLAGGAGDDILDGGLGADRLLGGTGDDTYFVDNAGDVVVENAGEGVDTVKANVSYALSANVENLSLTGSQALAGTGNGLNNCLQGNDVANRLDGGAGTDFMAGGRGDDTYVVDSQGDQVVEGIDAGIDTVETGLDYALGANVENLVLTGDANVSGTGNELANVLAGNAGDNVLDGQAGADVLAGGAGNDTYGVDNIGDVVVESPGAGLDTVRAGVTYGLSAHVENLVLTGTADIDGMGNDLDNVLIGNSGGNVLDGVVGADILAGGAGDDAYVVDNGGDRVVEAAGEGMDTVYSSVTYGLSANVETLKLTGTANIDGTGNELDNLLVGNAGNNFLDGGAGADGMAGSAGDDTYIVDHAGDGVVEAAGEGIDTVFASVAYGLSADVEDLKLTGTADIDGTGNGLDNLLIGNSGSNVLDGGAGADSLAGGAGNDIYVVDNAGDAVIENPGAGLDTVRAGITYGLSAHVENLVLTGTADIDGLGNELDNALAGNAGSNVLDGGTGADTMAGAAGDDTYIVDHTGDTVAEAAGEGIDTVRASVSYALSANVEHLVLAGTADTAGTGNELANTVTGNAGSNVLDGGAGVDGMAGAAGDDTYVVDEAGDTVVEAAGEGDDTIRSSVTYTLSANVEHLVLTGTGDIDGTGNELANTLTGNGGRNVLDGAAGADILSGGAGDDTYIVDVAGDVVVEAADEGRDTTFASVTYGLSAHVEDLVLTGTAGIDGSGNDLDNVLLGNSGRNVLDGGTGADRMAGGAGSDDYLVDNIGDLVVEAAGKGTDTVFASVTYGLSAHVEDLTLTGSADIDGTGNDLDNVLVGNAGSNVLDGGLGADALLGGAGDDTYVVDNAADTVTERIGEGNDTIRSSVTYTLSAQVENLVLMGTADIDGTGNELDNTLTGNAGSNVLDGAAGADRMAGGAGDDSYIVDAAGDTVAEAVGEGVDTVYASVTYGLSADVENLTLTGSADIDGTGNELDNALIGNAGNNVLDGGAGADVLRGDRGNDTYRVENAGDTVWEAAGEGVDSIYSSVSYVLPENVENLYLVGAGNISGGGNGLDNILVGNSGDNVLSGAGGNDSVEGRDGNDLLDGGEGNDLLSGGAGSDVLSGGTGVDQLDGGAGDDAYVVGLGDGLDGIVDGGGRDAVRFGAGLSLDNVALRVTQENGAHTAHVRVLNAAGCEQTDQGFDFAVTMDAQGRYVSPIEAFQFADGSTKVFDDLLIKTRVTYGNSKTTTITTGRDDDIIFGGSHGDTIFAGSGHDIVFAGSGGDTVTGWGGNDYLQGNTGNDTFDGGCGNDVLAGANGTDLLRDGGGNNALFGGGQDDRIEAGAGNDFIAGGKQDDLVFAAGGANVVAFNSGDGADTVLPGVGASNTLSLGGGIKASSLAFQKVGMDLVLQAGGRDRMTFKDWYASAANQNFVALQTVEAVASPTGWEIDRYDFKALVQQFDAARAASPKLSQWSLMNGTLDAHLASSDSAALGGELATRYAAGGESAISLGMSRETLKDASFGAQAQAVGSRFDSTVAGYRLS